jgi:hypothetical protein
MAQENVRSRVVKTFAFIKQHNSNDAAQNRHKERAPGPHILDGLVEP